MKAILKKVIVAATAVAGLLFTANAQIVSGGVVGGVSTGTVEISNFEDHAEEVLKGKSIRGFEAGIYGKLQLGYFYARPQIMYGFQSGTVNRNRDGLGADYEIHNLQIPVYLGFNLLGPVSIEAGPVYNYVISVTDNYNGIAVQQANNALGYRAGAAVDFGKIIINASYEGLTYKGSRDRIELKQPGRFIAGLAIRVGSGDNGGGDIRSRNKRRSGY